MPHVSSGPPASAGRLPGPGDRLPDGVAAALRVAPGAWRAGRESVVVVLLSSADAAAPGYVRELAAADAAFRAWDGRVFVLVEDGRGDGARLVAEATGAPPPVVLADGGGVRRALGLAAGAAGVVVADRWGQVYHATEADAASGLPAPPELEEWLRFLATQCPECGVPDEPGPGEWSR